MSLFRLFNCGNDGELSRLKEENKALKEKLAERQEIINKTNAYWKKKLSAASRSKGQTSYIKNKS